MINLETFVFLQRKQKQKQKFKIMTSLKIIFSAVAITIFFYIALNFALVIGVAGVNFFLVVFLYQVLKLSDNKKVKKRVKKFGYIETNF